MKPTGEPRRRPLAPELIERRQKMLDAIGEGKNVKVCAKQMMSVLDVSSQATALCFLKSMARDGLLREIKENSRLGGGRPNIFFVPTGKRADQVQRTRPDAEATVAAAAQTTLLAQYWR